jgi:hypothetical protein
MWCTPCLNDRRRKLRKLEIEISIDGILIYLGYMNIVFHNLSSCEINYSFPQNVGNCKSNSSRSNGIVPFSFNEDQVTIVNRTKGWVLYATTLFYLPIAFKDHVEDSEHKKSVWSLLSLSFGCEEVSID